MARVVTRHEFLDMLHYQLRPRGYLEIGVLFGDSLRLAHCPAFGVDPEPVIYGHLSETSLYRQTSDDFFASIKREDLGVPIDLVFIDGMHLFEYALRDFRNAERTVSNRRTVVVFDDVLPRNQGEASRTQCPGDWTGDVWKIWYLLNEYRPDLHVRLVDTDPTGTMVVWGLRPDLEDSLLDDFEAVEDVIQQWNQVPSEVIARQHARQPDEVLKTLEAWCASP